jgi:hypothetical protein
LWAYFDESGEFEGEPQRFVNMTVGGCIASFKAWQEFAPNWSAVLASEGVECFHMVDFENFTKPFDWFLEDGTRDHARHRRFLNALLDVLLDHCTKFVGFNYFPMGEKRQQREAYKRCIQDAVKGCNRDLAQEFETGLSVVFASYPEVPESTVQRIFEQHNLNNRLLSCTVTSPSQALPLQAADLVAYEMARVQRPKWPERYPFSRLKEKATVLTVSTKWDNARWDAMPWDGRAVDG